MLNNPYYHDFNASLDGEIFIGTAILLGLLLLIVMRLTRDSFVTKRKGVIVRARKSKALCVLLHRRYTRSGRAMVMPSASTDGFLAILFGCLEFHVLYRFCHAGVTQLMLNVFGELVGLAMAVIVGMAGIFLCVAAMWVYTRMTQLAVVAVRLHYHDKHGDSLCVAQRTGISDIVFSITKKGRNYAKEQKEAKARHEREVEDSERASRYYQYEELREELREQEQQKNNRAAIHISVSHNREKQRRAK